MKTIFAYGHPTIKLINAIFASLINAESVSFKFKLALNQIDIADSDNIMERVFGRNAKVKMQNEIFSLRK